MARYHQRSATLITPLASPCPSPTDLSPKSIRGSGCGFFRGRAVEFPELIPEPDHFALFLDSHGHLQINVAAKRDAPLEQNKNKKSSPSPQNSPATSPQASARRRGCFLGFQP